MMQSKCKKIKKLLNSYTLGKATTIDTTVFTARLSLVEAMMENLDALILFHSSVIPNIFSCCDCNELRLEVENSERNITVESVSTTVVA